MPRRFDRWRTPIRCSEAMTSATVDSRPVRNLGTRLANSVQNCPQIAGDNVTQWQMLELCKCKTDRDAKRVAKKAIQSLKRKVNHHGTIKTHHRPKSSEQYRRPQSKPDTRDQNANDGNRGGGKTSTEKPAGRALRFGTRDQHERPAMCCRSTGGTPADGGFVSSAKN